MTTTFANPPSSPCTDDSGFTEILAYLTHVARLAIIPQILWVLYRLIKRYTHVCLDKLPHPQLILQRPPPIVSKPILRSHRKLKLSQPQHPQRIALPRLNGHHQVLHKRSRTDLPVAATRTVHPRRGIESGGYWRFGNCFAGATL